MRLVHSQTLQLHYFMDNDIPPYAILSHTWEDGEVSFQEMSSNDASITKKKGYNKIKRCCEVALKDGFEYAWVDTCCIDKTSSSELSEAINSMYRWYEDAEVCYVYIADYLAGTEKGVPGAAFASSRWFTRGWTLQELIAPAFVLFFDREWKEIGSKSSLRDLISEITVIHVQALAGEDLRNYSVAQRMSWASKRQTTRIEDIAYCLLGIFEVNMPMLYGEGQRAFIRLQEAIIAGSRDHTIFAWEDTSEFLSKNLLAASPSYFESSSNTICAPISWSHEFTVTNKGIRLVLPITRDPTDNEVLAILDCQHGGSKDRKLLALRLNALYGELGTFYVAARRRLAFVEMEERKKETAEAVYIMQSNRKPFRSMNQYSHLVVDATSLRDVSLQDVYPALEESSISRFPRSMVLFGGLWAAFHVRDPVGNACVVIVSILLSRTFRWGLKIMLAKTGVEVNLTEFIAEDRRMLSFDPRDIRPDTLFWQHPEGRWWLGAVLKRRIVEGEKVLVLVLEKVII